MCPRQTEIGTICYISVSSLLFLIILGLNFIYSGVVWRIWRDDRGPALHSKDIPPCVPDKVRLGPYDISQWVPCCFLSSWAWHLSIQVLFEGSEETTGLQPFVQKISPYLSQTSEIGTTLHISVSCSVFLIILDLKIYLFRCFLKNPKRWQCSGTQFKEYCTRCSQPKS